MSNLKNNLVASGYIAAILWVVTAAMWMSALVIGSTVASVIMAIVPLVVFCAVLATFFAAALAWIVMRNRQPADEVRATSGPMARVLSAMILVALAVSVYSILNSFALPNSYDKFAYENAGTFGAIAALLIGIVLSTLQRDIYWVSASKTARFDERQLRDRQQVFEKSYKLAALAVLAVTILIPYAAEAMPQVIQNHNGTVPGHMFWLFLDLAVLIYGLPLIVGAWRKR